MSELDSKSKHANGNKEPKPKYEEKNGRIYLAAIIANISAVAFGTCTTWPSPVGPKLRAQDTSDSPLDRPANATEESWIGSVLIIGGMFTPFIAGPLADKIGRKKVLLSSAVFFIIGYIILLLADDVMVLIVGRLIKGFGCGIVLCVVPIYVGEISNDQTRGATGSLISVFIVCGNFYVLCIGPFVAYMTLQYCCLVIPVILAVTFIFLPESPHYHIAKGQRMSATKSLQFLRSTQDAQAVEAELVNIENLVANSKVEKVHMLEILKTSHSRKALLISLGLILFQQFSGITIVLFYVQTIFESAHINFQAAIASIIVGSVPLISSAIAPLVIKRFRRKAILLNSAIFTCIALTALGYFFFAQIVLKDTRGITWLPVAALVLYILAFSIGFGPLPWTVLGEIFPTNVKANAAALTSCACGFSGLLISISYPFLVQLGTFYAFWLLAIFCVAAFFFVLFIVLETKDLSLEEIQNKLKGK